MKTIAVLCFFTISSIYSQESHNEPATEKHFKKNSISFAMTHTHIQSGVKNSVGDNWIAVPSFAINYNYNFSEKWSLGLHNDIIIEEFIVEDKRNDPKKNLNNENEENIDGIERSRPISTAVMLTFKPYKHIALLAGGGMEFSKNENFPVVRFGVEAPFHIPNNWEIYGTLTYDINIDAYNSINFGMGIAKLF